MNCTFHLLLALALVPGSLPRMALGGQAEHVVVVVWDGMRPDYVRPQYTPALYELAKRGTFFQQHHSCYITSTEVNGAALATGMYPQNSGILATSNIVPDLSWLGTYATEGFDVIRRGDLLSDGHYLGAATLARTLQQAGFPTITAGAKPVVLLHDRAPRKVLPAQKDSVTLFAGATLPRSILRSLEAIPEVGRFPSKPEPPTHARSGSCAGLKAVGDKVLTWLNGKPKIPPRSRLVDAWTTRALVHGLWKDGVPKYSLQWLSEPDASQHESGVGSENAEVGIGQSDQNLRVVIQALKDKGVFEKTDLLIVSDHGFSTVDRGPDLIKSLKKIQLRCRQTIENPEPGT
jgi:predicted AlkP superfamily pyrophosphatase or phosphodiesterase